MNYMQGKDTSRYMTLMADGVIGIGEQFVAVCTVLRSVEGRLLFVSEWLHGRVSA